MMSRRLALSRYERRNEQNIVVTGSPAHAGDRLMAGNPLDDHGITTANDASVRMHMLRGVAADRVL